MLVLDASVTLAWVFPDEYDPLANTVMEMIGEEGAAVPSIWVLDILNALLVGERRGRVTQADVVATVSLLGDLPIETKTLSLTGEGAQILMVARAQGLSAYDAAYLELSMRLAVPLATLDDRLKVAANALGIQTVER